MRDEWLRNALWLLSVFLWSSLPPQADKAFFKSVYSVLVRTHAHTQNMNVTTCIIDLRSQLQQTPSVIKKRLFCFISPLRFPYQLICIINSGWRCPREQLAMWFLLLGILSYFVESLKTSVFVVTAGALSFMQDYCTFIYLLHFKQSSCLCVVHF